MTYDNNAAIPDKLNDFYELAFSTLFNKHDATKDSFVREIRTGLGCEDFKLLFSYVCFKSYFADVFEFTDVSLMDYLSQAQKKFSNINFKIEDFQEDLTQSVCMLVKDGLVYHFSHRSFQEYFAALYTCKLTDDIQAKLLTAKIKETESIANKSYYSMLFNLQSEKFNKIILLPGIVEIKNLYEQLGFSIELICSLFSDISIRKVDDYSIPNVSLCISNIYLCNILILATKLNGYTSNNIEPANNEIYEKIFAHSNGRNMTLKIDELRQLISDEDILCLLSWVNSHLLFTINLYERFSNNNISRKKKVLSILEEL